MNAKIFLLFDLSVIYYRLGLCHDARDHRYVLMRKLVLGCLVDDK
jgi:hypothetical protein